MRTTLVDIAKKAGVHVSSVSLVLGNKPLAERMADSTKRRILSVAKEMNYRPNLVARALCNGKTATLGLICGDIHTPYFAELASEAMDVAEKNGHQLLVSVTKWDKKRELECIESLMQRGVDGIILYCNALKPETELYKNIVSHNFPVVTMEHCLPGLPHVVTDFTDGMQQAVELLQKNGHTSVGYVAQQSPGMAPDLKFSALKDVCSMLNDPFEVTVHDCGLGMQAAENLGLQLSLSPDCPKAFIVFSDYAATGFIRGLRCGGKIVPKDVDVISIDSTQWGAYQYPALTSIARDRKSLVENAINILLEQRNRNVSSDSVSSVVCPSSLMVRESVDLKRN